LLSLVTLGIYWVLWYYRINREMQQYGASHGDTELEQSRPVRSSLAVLLGPILLVSPIVSFVGAVHRLQRVELHATGHRRLGRSLIALLVIGHLMSLVRGGQGVVPLVSVAGFLMCLIGCALIQARLNSIWRQHGDGGAESPLKPEVFSLQGPLVDGTVSAPRLAG
jgi:hypothetical protein